MQESRRSHPSLPVMFHQAMSIRSIQVNSTDHSLASSSFEEKRQRREDCGDNDDDDVEEFRSLIDAPPIPPPLHRPNNSGRKRSTFQPFDITTPQQELQDEQRINAFVRIPSVHLSPRIRGSFSKSRRKYERSSRCCGCCCDKHHCCGWHTICGSSWITFCCRMVLLLFVMSGLIYYMQQQIVWQGRGDGLVSQKQRPKQTIFQDDDIVNLANSRSSRIRGDYSTVQGIQDLNALAAKVPVQCSEGNIDCPCAAVHERDNDESTINTRLDPIPGMLLRWDETHERNIQLANLQQVVPPELLYEDLNHEPQGYTASSQNNNTRTLSTAIAPNVVFLGDSITERWQGTKLGKVESADMQDAHKVFMELFQSDNMDAHPLLSNATAPPIHGLPLGIAGDQTPNLLWRLQNGELPSTLHPNIFVVLIGTNDLSKDGCSAENVVVGVVRIVEWLLQEREDATILLHGLLPRTFEEDGTLNPGNGHNWGNFLHHRNDDDDGVEDEASQHHFWPDIHVINDELQGYALFRDRVEYMDTNAFYSDTNGNHLSSGKLKLNMNLMPDGLHPSSEGCRIWGREIKTKLQEMLSTVGRG